MVYLNPTLARIKEKIVDPEVGKLRNTVVGYVTAVYYESRTCDLFFIDKDNARKQKKGIPFPTEGDGIYSQSLQPGDRVELAFRNQSIDHLYIAGVYKLGKKKSDLYIKSGQDFPQSTHLF